MMRAIVTMIGEAVAATLVVAACLSLPFLVGLPAWTLPLFFVPAMFYLDWRLGSNHCSCRGLVRWVFAMGLFLFLCNRFAPNGCWWLLYVPLVMFSPETWMFGRREKTDGSPDAT